VTEAIKIVLHPSDQYGIVRYCVVLSAGDRLVWREAGGVAGFDTWGEAFDHAANELPDQPAFDDAAGGAEVTERQAMRLTGLMHGMAALDLLRDQLAG
jgi:hypothetical protein